MFDLLGEPHILIYPPFNAIWTGVVRKYRLPWPNLQRRYTHENHLFLPLHFSVVVDNAVEKFVWYSLCKLHPLFSPIVTIPLYTIIQICLSVCNHMLLKICRSEIHWSYAKKKKKTVPVRVLEKQLWDLWIGKRGKYRWTKRRGGIDEGKVKKEKGDKESNELRKRTEKRRNR